MILPPLYSQYVTNKQEYYYEHFDLIEGYKSLRALIH